MSTFIENLGLLAIGWLVSYLVIYNYQRNKDKLEIREKVILKLSEAFNEIQNMITVFIHADFETSDVIQMTYDVGLKLAHFRSVLFTYVDDEEQFRELNDELKETLDQIPSKMRQESDQKIVIWSDTITSLDLHEASFREKIKNLIKPSLFHFSWRS